MSIPIDLGQRHEVHDAAAECVRLRAELANVRQERDRYLKTLYVMLRDEPKFTREDVAQARRQLPTFEELLEELEKPLGESITALERADQTGGDGRKLIGRTDCQSVLRSCVHQLLPRIPLTNSE